MNKTHTGRPIVRHNETHVYLLCPYGHYITGILKENWAGSLIESRAGDPNYTYECDGALVT
jgi:hypothetical protein